MNSEDWQSFIGLIALALLVALGFLLLTFGLVVILPASIVGIICYTIYKFYGPSPLQKLEQLRSQVEALEEKTEHDYRDTIYDKIGQDIRLDDAIGEIIYLEGLSEVPTFPKTDDEITIARYKDQATNYINSHDDDTFASALILAVEPLVINSPPGMFSGNRPVKLEEVEDLHWRFAHPRYFKKLHKQLEQNLEDKPKEPWDYIKDTPFELIADRPYRTSIKYPFEHLFILGFSGAGKTQLLQFMISERLKEDCTVIVIDNQAQMIPKLAKLGVDMQYISPHYPLALNIFDMGRGQSTPPLLRYTFNSLNADVTGKQNTLLQFCIEYVLSVKGNINTLYDLFLSKKGDINFSHLDPIAQQFFDNQFYKSGQDGFRSTKEQLIWRLWGILSNPSFRGMFAAKKNRCKLDLDRKLILIDCDIDHLQDYSGFFGRFFLAQILQLAQQRFKGKHKPIYVFVDEAKYYADHTISEIFETARKAKISLTLANHYLGQLPDAQITKAITSLTSTKFVSTNTPEDAAYMARAMRTTSDYILDQEPLHFAFWQKGEETVSIKVPVGVVEDMATHPIPHMEMIKRYGRPKDEPAPPEPEPTDPPEPIEMVEEEGDF